MPLHWPASAQRTPEAVTSRCRSRSLTLKGWSVRRHVLIASVSLVGCSLPFGSVASAQTASVLTGLKVYTSPESAPIEDGAVIVRDGKIVAVGVSKDVLPTAADTPPTFACERGVVVAGFQNSHVHFIDERFTDAEGQPASALSRALERMLTRYGYTTVVDTASQLENTTRIRQRIDSGDIVGPRILTVGAGIFPPDGLPIYISHLPKRFLDSQLTPGSGEDARRAVQMNLDHGADATKLFVATPQVNRALKRMTLDVARAAAQATHANGKLVMVHPTDLEGLRLALSIGADVLVHTTLGAEAPWPQDVLKQVLDQKVAIAPTFKLLAYELQKEQVPQEVTDRLMKLSLEHFSPFVANRGRVVFGTDVGYMTDDDPTDEYVLMHRAGMTPQQILASLTTEPARLWKEETKRGRIDAGMDADLVVLGGDPTDDVRHFADVRCAIRAGKVIYRR